MAAALVTVEWVGSWSAVAPSANTIDAAFARATVFGGRWAGPPRITRTSHLTEAARVRVAAVYVWGTPPYDLREPLRGTDAPADVLQRRVQEELPLIPLGVWGPVVVGRYLPAANGPLEWWTSGEAANTRTRDILGTLAGVALPDETPNGPITPANTPPSAPARAAEAAEGAAWSLAPWALAALALYALAQSRRSR